MSRLTYERCREPQHLALRSTAFTQVSGLQALLGLLPDQGRDPRGRERRNVTGRADYPHVTNFEASVHGYWVVLSGTCPSTAKVTVDLRAVECTPFGCVWITQDTRSGTFTPGSGTGHRATPHKACANAKKVGWRGQVDVDLTGVNDPSGFQYSPEVNLACSPA